MHRHHKRALLLGGGAVLADIACGLSFSLVTPHLPAWHGLYCSLADAVTRGGDCQLRTGWQYLLSALECITVIPLFAATYSLVTSGLAGGQVQESEDRIKRHMTEQISTPELLTRE